MIKKTLNKMLEVLPNRSREYLLKIYIPKIFQLRPFGRIYQKIYLRHIRNKTHHMRYTTLVIEPFNVCNLRCTMCAYAQAKIPKKKMSLELYEKILKDAKRNHINNVCLSYFNEPLMDSDIFERIAMTKKEGMTIGIISNGTLMNKDMIKKICKSDMDSMLISIDGATKKTYESIRDGSNFSLVLNNVKNLKKYMVDNNIKKPEVVVGFLIQNKNVHERKKFEKVFGKYFKVAWGFPDEYVTADDILKNKEVLPSGLKLKRNYDFPCWNMAEHLTVRSDGTMLMCCGWYTENPKFILGDLKKQTIRQVWDSKKFRKIRELHFTGKSSQLFPCNVCQAQRRTASWVWWFH